MKKINPQEGSNRIEVFISGVGSVVCILTTDLIWSSLAPVQGLWLLPGLYFVELMLGAVTCFLAYLRKVPQAAGFSWAYSGLLIVFILLASFSVGFLYLPVLLIFGGLSIYSIFRRKPGLLKPLGIFLVSGLVQLALMLVLVWVSI